MPSIRDVVYVVCACLVVYYTLETLHNIRFKP